jgi:hypothetical protein
MLPLAVSDRCLNARHGLDAGYCVSFCGIERIKYGVELSPLPVYRLPSSDSTIPVLVSAKITPNFPLLSLGIVTK